MTWTDEQDDPTRRGRRMLCQSCANFTFHLWADPANFCMLCGSRAYIERCQQCAHPLYNGHFCGNCGVPYHTSALLWETGAKRIIDETPAPDDFLL